MAHSVPVAHGSDQGCGKGSLGVCECVHITNCCGYHPSLWETSQGGVSQMGMEVGWGGTLDINTGLGTFSEPAGSFR